jgi:transposase
MFKDGGIERLLEIKQGRGRKSKIPNATKERFIQEVIDLQKSRSGGRVIGKDIVLMIQEKYTHRYSVSGVYKVLKRIGLSWVSSRSIHPKTNILTQEKFKEDFLKYSKEQSS